MSPSPLLILLLVVSLSSALCQEIKVLVSDGCVAVGETSDQTSGGKAVSLSPGAPLVLTHQIHLLSPGPGPGSCEGLAELRQRIESLEKEVSVLRERCGDPENPGCCSSKESQGAGCSIAPGCHGDCSDQGRCVDGRCVCFPGFSGPDCSLSSCPENCSTRGRCVDGTCLCDPGFSGPDCSLSSCTENCSTRGRCVDGRCLCDPGFTGDDCDTVMSAPEQLRTEDLTQSSVTVVWTQPPVQYEKYLLTFTSQKDDSVLEAEVPGSRSSFAQSGLAPGQIYSVTVTGATGERRGAPGSTQFTTLPSGPSDLRVVKSSTSSVVVQWAPSASAVDRYRLSVSRSDGRGGGRELTFDPGTSSAHITQLEAGLSYDITLVAESGRSQSRPISTQATPGSANVLAAAITAPPSSERREAGSTNKNESQIPGVTKVIRRIELMPPAGTDPGAEGGSGIDLASPGPKITCLNRVAVTHGRAGPRDQSCRDRGKDGAAKSALRGHTSQPERPQTSTDLDVVSPDPLQKLLTDTFQNLNITAFGIRLSQSEPSNIDANAQMVARQIMQGSKPSTTIRKSITSSQQSSKPHVTSLFLLNPQSTTASPTSTTQMSSLTDASVGNERPPLHSEGNVTNYRRTQSNQSIIRRLRPNPWQFRNNMTKSNDDSLSTSSGIDSVSVNADGTASFREANVVNLDDIGVSEGENQGRDQSTRQGAATFRRIPVNSRFNGQNLNRSHNFNRNFRRPIRIQSGEGETASVTDAQSGHMENINGKGFNRSRPGFPRRPNSYMGPFQNRTRLPFRSPQRGAVGRNWTPERAQNGPNTGPRESTNKGTGTSPSDVENMNLEEERNRLNDPKKLGRDSTISTSNIDQGSSVLDQPSGTEDLHGSSLGTTEPQRVIQGERVEENVQNLPEDEPRIDENGDSRNLSEEDMSFEGNIAKAEAGKSATEVRIGQEIQEDFAKQDSRDPNVVAGLHASRATKQFDEQDQERSASFDENQRNSRGENGVRVFRRPFKPGTHPAQTRRRILMQDQVRNGTRSGFKVDATSSRLNNENNLEPVATDDQDEAKTESKGEHSLENGEPTLPRGGTQPSRTVLRRLRPNLWQFRKRTGLNSKEGGDSKILTEESSLSSKEATNLDDQSLSEDGTQSWSEIRHDEKPEESLTSEEEEEGPGGSRAINKASPTTDYRVTVLGRGSGVLSRLHKLVISTGPEPPSDLVFSSVTEDSVTVSWTRPKSKISGFKLTYTHSEEGEPVSVSLDRANSSVLLSSLTPGSEYEVSVLSVLGLDESDALSKTLHTLPDPPTDLRAVNVSDSGALLLWRPSLAKVDHYSIVYGAGTGSEVRVSVSGKSTEKRLSGLGPSTTYSVTVSSELDTRQSREATTSFTTTSGSSSPGDLRATNVKPRSATLSWKPPSRPVISYRVTYWTEGQRKEVSVGAIATQLNLTRLFPGSTYEVELQTDDGGDALRTSFTTGSLRFPFPSDCSQEQLNGLTESGLVDIFPLGQQGAALSVWCDMDTDGGGWTVFQRRKDGSVDFFRTWREYVQGFGDPSGEFWLGLDALHALTSGSSMTLRVDLSDGLDSAFAVYSTFAVAKRNYRLTVGGYSGTAGDSMSYHNNRIFSTKDRDPGSFVTRCAMSYRGGWWYKNCHEANLNGLYRITSKHQGIIWTSWKGKEESIPFTEMKMRPTDFILNTNNYNNYRA